MAGPSDSRLPRLTPEQRRAAAGQFERANQVLAKGDFDYALPLLLNCCVIDPANPVYRQVLRKAARDKYGNNRRGQALSNFTNLRQKFQLRKAKLAGNPLKILEHAEHILLRNPWDVATQMAQAEAFEELQLSDLAIWTLEQARQADGNHTHVNRFLARLYEKRGNFNQAIALWQLVRKADPADAEAHNKAMDLAASATIAKGKYNQVLEGESPPIGPADNVPAAIAAAASSGASPEASLPAGEPASDDRVREAPALLAKIKANPTNPHGYIHLAHLYRRVDQFDKAQSILREGLTATNNHFDLGQELLDLEIEPFRRDLGIAEAELRRDPEHAELQKVKQHLEREISARELQYYRQRVDRFPTDTSAKFEMSLRLMRVGQVDEAIKELQGLRSDPRHQSKVLVYLGFCFRSRNNWRLAQRNFEEALQHLGPADEALRKEVLYQLAQGYADAGETVRAVDLGCELGNLDFGYKDISQLLDKWQAKLQKT